MRTLALLRGRVPIAAYETETRSWDYPTARGIFRDAGFGEAGDGIAFLKGRWTRKGRPVDGGWSFAPARGQVVEVAYPDRTATIRTSSYATRVPYATVKGAARNPRRPAKRDGVTRDGLLWHIGSETIEVTGGNAGRKRYSGYTLKEALEEYRRESGEDAEPNPRRRARAETSAGYQRALGGRIRAAAGTLGAHGRAIAYLVSHALLTARVVEITQKEVLDLERSLAHAGHKKTAGAWRRFVNSIGKHSRRPATNPRRGGKQLTGRGTRSSYHLAIERDRHLWYLYIVPASGKLAFSGDVSVAGAVPSIGNSLTIRGLEVARRWARGRGFQGEAADAIKRGQRFVLVDSRGRILETLEGAQVNARRKVKRSAKAKEPAAPALLELDYFEIVKRFGEPREVTAAEALKVPERRRWTLVDSDSGALLTSGMAYVNRLDYYVTPRPWPAGTDVVELPDPDDADDAGDY